MPLPTVTSAKGDEYSVDSPQGKMILGARNRAAESAAKAAVASKPVMEGSTIAAVGIVIDKHLQTISDNVVSIGESVETMVTIAQADTRGDALNSANVPQDDLQPVQPDADGVYRGGKDGGAGGGDDGGLGGLVGMGLGIGSFGKGLKVWADPRVLMGGGALIVFIGLLIGAAWLGAKAFRDAVPDVVEGMELLSDADVDTEKVIQLGKALATFGGALAAEGIGAGIGSIGSFVTSVVDGIGSFFGFEKRDPLAELAKFAETPITEAQLKQIEINARALTVFGGAMTAEGVGTAVQSIATTVSALFDGVSALIYLIPGMEKADPMQELRDFADWEFSEADVAQIKRNALALIGFQSAMSVTKTIDVVESAADLITGVFDGLRALIPVDAKDPMLEMRKFADHKFTQADVNQITLNAAALLGFQTAMSVTKTIGVVESAADLITGVFDGLRALIPVEARDPMKEMRKFADWKFTPADAAQIELNAEALLMFSRTMSVTKPLETVGSIADLLSGVADGLMSFFGLKKKDPMEDMKKFAGHTWVTEESVKQIELNAKALVNFSKAMAAYSAGGAAADALNMVGSMAKGVTDFFGGTTGIDYEEIKTFAESGIGDLEPKITANATALSTFATAMKGMAGDKIDVEWKNIGANILGAIGGFFGGTAEENLMKNFDAIEDFTKRTLDLNTVDNNIQAINKFMEFGASWVGFKGGDFKAVGDFAEALVISANGIHTAMYGGEYIKPGWEFNITIPDGKGLASVQLGDMTMASKGIAVLRHSLIAQDPLKELQSATAAMDASTGAVTVINANNNSSNTNSSQQNNYQEMNIDHNEQTGHWWSRNSDLNPY